jgi:hypothetical protein
MSRKDAAVLASRTLALLLIVWALADVFYLPEYMYSFLRHLHEESVLSAAHGYWYYYYLIRLGFLLVRIVGFSLAARWLFNSGPKVEKLFLPVASDEAAQN